jgi:hypothetical protein
MSTLSQLHPRPQTQSRCMAPAQWTHPLADAQWTRNARRTEAPAGASTWTQDTRVLDAVFDKLFLGSTVIHASGKYVTLAIEPCFCVRDIS